MASSVFCCSAVQGPPDLDPIISIFVTLAKEYSPTEEDVYYRGMLRSMQTKLFGLELFQRPVVFRLDPQWLSTPINFARPWQILRYIARPASFVPRQGDGGPEFARIPGGDPSISD